MNTNVSFRHMDSSPALRDYATGKLERVVDKYVHGRVEASVVLSVEKFRHIANFTVQIKNLTVKGDYSSEDMYSSIDLALDKIERQLRRHKDRLRDYKPSNADKGMPFRMSVVVPAGEESEIEEEFAEDFENYPAPEPPEESEVSEAVEEDLGEFATLDGPVGVARARDYEAPSMRIEEAVLQLSLLEDREFFVFTNNESKSINIIYKRADGKFGLIET
ncbi:MAG: ribosome-associated translation inhibitor RaiA [Myxococcota bacterium]|jgi:putative sigma-54 modulation protein|nr:ribosome-associated translation inhibitor RaiA [Myxococcota bacterium]MEC9442095.1 ribosome-associated translation inhibitor RaiA [Myxococcota bacterium]